VRPSPSTTIQIQQERVSIKQSPNLELALISKKAGNETTIGLK